MPEGESPNRLGGNVHSPVSH